MDDNREKPLTYEQKAVNAAKGLQGWLAENVPELRGAAIVLHWQDHLKDVSVPFVWTAFSEEEDLSLAQLAGLGHSLEQLQRFRLATMLQREQELLGRIRTLERIRQEELDAQDTEIKIAAGGEPDGSGHPDEDQGDSQD